MQDFFSFTAVKWAIYNRWDNLCRLSGKWSGPIDHFAHKRHMLLFFFLSCPFWQAFIDLLCSAAAVHAILHFHKHFRFYQVIEFPSKRKNCVYYRTGLFISLWRTSFNGCRYYDREQLALKEYDLWFRRVAFFSATFVQQLGRCEQFIVQKELTQIQWDAAAFEYRVNDWNFYRISTLEKII